MGEQFKFQWTFYSKLAQFPFKWNMRNVPFFRFYVGTIAALFPFFAYVQEKVVYHMRYAKMLADKIQQHKANAWLLNTGWAGAGYAQGGKRCPLKYTRAILDAIHSGELAKVEYENYEVFNLQVPKTCPNVPDELLNPKKAWTASTDFDEEVTKLAKLFVENFDKYKDEATDEVIKAGPQV